MHSSAHLSTPSGSNSSSGPSASGSTMTSRRTSSRTSGTSNSTASKHASAQSSSSASSSSKWKLVRPWQPPSSNTEATLEDGNQHSQQQAHDSEDDDANEDEDGPAEDSASSAVLAPSSSKMKRMHLEVVDVSSTSVSLSVFGQSAQESQMQQNNHRMDTSLGSTSSMANQTTAVRRSRAASTSSERPLSNPPQPPNISIKLNSAAWPHVFHTDASFFDSDSSRQSSDDQSLSSSSILVWGLSPGQNYHIELGVFEEGMDEGKSSSLEA